MNKIILIGGGVGPMAGIELHRLVLSNTKASSDQEHLRIIHLCCPDMIPDRTNALLKNFPAEPAKQMAGLIIAGANSVNSLNCKCVVGVPCNTFHAEPIWNEFIKTLAENNFSHPVLNMVDETISHIIQNHQTSKQIGILSTTGTREFAIYSKPLKASGFEVIEPEDQEKTHSLIYNKNWGIKANTNIHQKAKNILKQQIAELSKKGARTIILGCTELPLAADNEPGYPVLIDPMTVLAKSLVSWAEKDL